MSTLQIKYFVVGDLQVNCMGIYSKETNTIAIIDPGDDASDIVDFANSMRDPAKETFDKVLILLTHAHFDHAGGLQGVRRGLKANEVYVHADDKPLFDNLKMQPQMFGMAPFPEQPDQPTKWLNGGEKIELAPGVALEVLHTPGHTPGSVCYYLEPRKILFSGDTLFERSCGRTDLPLGNTEKLVRSVKNLYKTLPDDTRVLPGHGSFTTIGEEKHTNMVVRL